MGLNYFVSFSCSFSVRGVILAQTDAPGQTCESRNGTSCEQCLTNVTCLWCIKTQLCLTYPVQSILPPSSLCPLNEARWGLCSINFQILIITMSVVAGALIIAFFVCLFCCCKCENCGSSVFEHSMQRKEAKRKIKQENRKSEMRARHDEIRKKYGLSRASPYSRFENPP
ncbi:PTTG1 interacting protein a [Electrophorus electricus]|uniref:PSI domain-containing protein n=1 Tax=Electrophorus electricus TaxID=8005 RepID=A0A4W4H585_ELEEL|nr:PTTG1 interacting protein a [Electrophorus electricus]